VKTRAFSPTAPSFISSKLFLWLISAITFISGLLTAIHPLADRLPEKFTEIILPVDPTGESFLLVGFGLVLMYLAYELLQRKRAAWWLALIFALSSFVLHIEAQPSLPAAIAAGIVVIVLLLSRKEFNSRIHAANVWQGFSVLVASIAFALAYGTFGFWLLDKRDFGVTFSFGQSFIRTLKSYLLLGNGDITAHTRYGHWFLQSLAVVGVLALTYSLFSLFRPLKNRLRTVPGERQEAKILLERYGGETDDFFKLWPHDKAYFFSSDGKAFIAYGVARGVAVGYAGPVGDSSSVPLLLAEFKQFSLENGWTVVFAHTSNRYAEDMQRADFNSLLIGADAVIDLEKFNNVTSNNKYFRNISNRFEKLNYKTEILHPPHPPDLIKELKSVSSDWLNRPGRKQWRFFTGYFSNYYLQQTPLFVLRDKNNKALAFVNQIPSFKRNEATIDLMRHGQDAPANIMDFLFIRFSKLLAEQGFKKFNLGLSAYAARDFADSPSDKILAALYGSNQRFISFKGLHRYKAKFEPEWQPRYLYYQGNPSRLPQIGLAIAKLIKY